MKNCFSKLASMHASSSCRREITGETGLRMKPVPEREMLLQLLRSEVVGTLLPEQWQKVVFLAQQHGVAPLLYRQIKRLGSSDPLPADMLRVLHEDYLATAHRNTLIYHELGCLVNEFSRKGVDVILLKGAFLAETIYGNIAARPMGDVDVLVRQRDLRQARQSMLDLGFEATHQNTEMIQETRHFVYQNKKNGLYIEVHWDLIGALYRIGVDIDGLWERSTPGIVAELPIKFMSPEDQVLHLCIHACEHVFEPGLRQLCDLAETIQHHRNMLDWELLRQRAIQWRADRAAYLCFALVRDLLQAPVPESWLESLHPADFNPNYLNLARDHIFSSAESTENALPIISPLGEYWIEKRWSRIVGFLWRHVFVSRQYMALFYPVNPKSWRVFLYYPIRFLDLMKKGGRTMFLLLIGNRQETLRAERQGQLDALKNWLLSASP
jgi:hypothetical protein